MADAMQMWADILNSIRITAAGQEVSFYLKVTKEQFEGLAQALPMLFMQAMGGAMSVQPEGAFPGR